jgi:hypothetical protein
MLSEKSNSCILTHSFNVIVLFWTFVQEEEISCRKVTAPCGANGQQVGRNAKYHGVHGRRAVGESADCVMVILRFQDS